MTWPKRIVIAGVLLGVYGGNFFYFLLPTLADLLLVTTVVFLIPLFVFSLAALFKLRRKLISIFAIVWVLGALPFVAFGAPSRWLQSLGFYVHALLTQGHPPSCSPIKFVENGVEQTVGFCRGFDHGTFIIDVVYDTTGEFVLPASQRTPEWKQAMSQALSPLVVSEEGRARHLYGNFYSVFMNLSDFQG